MTYKVLQMLHCLQNDFLMTHRQDAELFQLVGPNAQQLSTINLIVCKCLNVKAVHAFQTFEDE